MWLQYIIVSMALTLSIIYLIRYFLKKAEKPVCEGNCKGCEFAKDSEITCELDAGSV